MKFSSLFNFTWDFKKYIHVWHLNPELFLLFPRFLAGSFINSCTPSLSSQTRVATCPQRITNSFSTTKRVNYQRTSLAERLFSKITCPDKTCRKSFVSKGTLQRHLNHVHYNFRLYPCPITACRYKSKTASDLQDHIARHGSDAVLRGAYRSKFPK